MKYNTTFYLVRNGDKQPLYNPKNGQLNLYVTKKDAQSRVNKTKIIDKLTGKKREIVKVLLEVITDA